MADNCITSTLQLCSGKASLRTGQGEYRPLNPVSSSLYKIVEDYWEMFINHYEDKFQEKYGLFRPAVKSEMENYLNCSILRNGFICIRRTNESVKEICQTLFEKPIMPGKIK
jgi:hypothetical protein